MVRGRVHPAFVRTVREHLKSRNPTPASPPFVPVTASPRTTISFAVKIQVAPFQRVRLALAHPRNGQAPTRSRRSLRESRPCPTRISAISALKLLGARQRDLFPAQWRTFQSRRGISVNHTGFDCDGQNVLKERERVVVISGRHGLWYALAHFLQSACVILRISVSSRPGQLLLSAKRRCRQ